MIMSIIIEAIYEDGVLKPSEPLPLQEHAKVRVTIEAPEQEGVRASVEAAVEAVRRSHGLIPWSGDLETLDRLAIDPEFDPQEQP
jgi:predicted DNA-binding antitoxin AbrB/MazE fold protein